MIPAKITIAIITYKRPELLSKCLKSIGKLKITEEIDLSVLVVDNDHMESSRKVAVDLKNQVPFTLIYESEPEKGIPNARNKVLDICKEQDYIGFIDDDDEVDKNWLVNIYDTLKRYKADVVKGYVNYIFDEEKQHLKALDIFSNPPQETGEKLQSAWTNNVLLSTEVYKNNNLRFDKRFTKIGGSDNHFFSAVNDLGFNIVMSREAIVNSEVTKKRSSFFWILRRNVRVGATLTISNIYSLGYKEAFIRLIRYFPECFRYFINMTRLAFSKNITFLSPIMFLGFVFGRIIGLLKISPREYK